MGCVMSEANPTRQDVLLDVVDVYKAFHMPKSELVVLQGAGMQVFTGELLGIVGASGVGKSTLLHILGGLDRPSKGQVLFRGDNIYTRKNDFLDTFRNVHVGFVFQFFNLLPEFTVLENVMFPALIGNRNKKAAREHAEYLLGQMGLTDRLQHKPGEISGGESQRVALARALINKPDLVLADEPTGNLDTHSSHALMELIRRLNSEFRQTFAIVTHSQRIASGLDRVLQLADRKITTIDREVII